MINLLSHGADRIDNKEKSYTIISENNKSAMELLQSLAFINNSELGELPFH